MRKKNKRRIIVSFLTIALASLFTDRLFATQEYKLIQELEKSEKQTPESKEVSQGLEKLKPNIIEYKADSFRDPFQSPIKTEKAIPLGSQQANIEPALAMPPDLSVQGIIWGGNNPCAIINNKVVKIGDTIEGAKITDINKEGVTVFFGNQKYILSPYLKLKPEEEPGGGQYEKQS